MHEPHVPRFTARRPRFPAHVPPSRPMCRATKHTCCNSRHRQPPFRTLVPSHAGTRAHGVDVACRNFRRTSRDSQRVKPVAGRDFINRPRRTPAKPIVRRVVRTSPASLAVGRAIRRSIDLVARASAVTRVLGRGGGRSRRCQRHLPSEGGFASLPQAGVFARPERAGPVDARRRECRTGRRGIGGGSCRWRKWRRSSR